MSGVKKRRLDHSQSGVKNSGSTTSGSDSEDLKPLDETIGQETMDATAATTHSDAELKPMLHLWIPSSEKSKRRVTYEQLEHLWVFLNENRGIAMGFNKTAQARYFSKRMWENVSNDLNSLGNGAVKDGRGWCKYWNDYKSKLKKMASAARIHQKSLSDVEKKFLQIVGQDFGSRLPGIKVVPFPKGTVEDIEVAEIACDTWLVNMDSGTHEQDSEGSESRITPAFNSVDNINPQPGSSLRMTSPPSIPPSATSPQLSIPPTATSPRISIPPTATHINNFSTRQLRHTPHHSQRRRRLRRREVPSSQEVALRTLIQISERRLAIEERNSQTLIGIQASLVEIKDLLRSRSLGHPRDDE